MTGPLVLTLPLPPKPCHQNDRSGWRARARATKQAREWGRLACLVALAGEPPPRWERAHVTFAITYPDHIRRDVSNTASAAKAYLDSLQDSGIVRDDRGITLTVQAPRVDRATTGLTMTIEPLGGEQ